MDKHSSSADVRLVKAERREHTARLALQTEERANQALQVLQFFANRVRTLEFAALQAELVRMLDLIAELELMLLPEHRSGVCGGIAATAHALWPDDTRPDDLLPVDLKEARAASSGEHYKVIEAAVRLTPPREPGSYTRAQQVEWLWVAWLVSRRPGLLSLVVRLSTRADGVGDVAYMLLANNVELPEINEALQRALASRRNSTRTSGAPLQAKQDTTALRLLITADPVWKKQVLFVAWRPADAGETFEVVTVDGGVPAGCPSTWRSRPVVVRAPNKAELAVHERIKAQHEDV